MTWWFLSMAVKLHGICTKRDTLVVKNKLIRLALRRVGLYIKLVLRLDCTNYQCSPTIIKFTEEYFVYPYWAMH